MSDRYLLSGVQLGMIQSYAKSDGNVELYNLIDNIIENQHLFNSQKELMSDIITISECVKNDDT